ERQDRRREDQEVLRRPGQPDPDRLADDELARRCRADQELHHPARLLGDDARGDPHPVDDDRDEDQDPEHCADDQPAREVRGAVRRGCTAGAGLAEDVEGGQLEPVDRIPGGEVEDRDAEDPDRELLQRAVPHRLAEVERERQAPVHAARRDQRRVVAPVVDPGDRLRLVGQRDQLERAGLVPALVQQLVEHRDRPLREIRILGDDRDLGHGPLLGDLGDDREKGHDDRQDGQGHRRDVEQPRADELQVFAPGDVARVREHRLVAAERRQEVVHAASSVAPASGARRMSSSAGRPTWSMKICSSDGSATSKWVTRAPAAMAAARTASGSTPSSSSTSVRSMPGRRIRAPATPDSQARRWSPSTEMWTIRRPVARLTSRSGPPTTTRPRSTIAIDSHIASTVSIWWVEKMSVRPSSRSSRNASRSSATLTGSSPVNGSSISRTGGLWRIAQISWIFCWLPLLSSSALRSARSDTRSRRSQSRAVRRALSRGIPWSEPKNTS